MTWKNMSIQIKIPKRCELCSSVLENSRCFFCDSGWWNPNSTPPDRPYTSNSIAYFMQKTPEEKQKIKNIKKRNETSRIQKAHSQGKHHLVLCDQNSCTAMAASHNSNHDECTWTFCDTAKIRDAHNEGKHNIHCDPDTCEAMKKSHETSHYICKDTFCDSSLKQRELAQWLELTKI